MSKFLWPTTNTRSTLLNFSEIAVIIALVRVLVRLMEAAEPPPK